MQIYGINPVLEALRAKRVTAITVSSRADERVTGVVRLAGEQGIPVRRVGVEELDRLAGGGASHRHHLYLLTDCDLPFVQDELRDGETIRQWMTRRFEELLTERGLPWVKISGSGQQRLLAAVCEVDRLLE